MKSCLGICEYPFATSQAWKWTGFSFLSSFTENTHLHPMGFQPPGKLTSFQVSIFWSCSSSIFIASSHLGHSREVFASFTVCGVWIVLECPANISVAKFKISCWISGSNSESPGFFSVHLRIHSDGYLVTGLCNVL